MPPQLTRRRFGLGLAACTLATAADAVVPDCLDQNPLPDWVERLRADLEQMARELTARLQPWKGPQLVLTPEEFGLSATSARDALATHAIQAAIDTAAQRGGGTVRLAHGDYTSGTLDLRSNVRLEVARGARLLASLDLKDYPPRVPARPTIMDSNMGVTQSLIFAQGCRNISLSGEGVIDGRGTKQNFPGAETVGATPGRPFLIRVLDCQGVHVAGLHLRDAACWMQNYLNCEDLLIERLRVENQANFNNDGVDIDGCRRVIVRHCDIDSEDDAVCFKGASERPTEQVLVENCRLYSSTNGIKFGTDSQGDFRRILVRDLEVGGPSAEMRSLNPRRADSGVSWEVVDGGTAENILATRIHVVRAESPLFLRLGDRGRVRPGEPRPSPGTLRRVVFDEITGADNGSRGSYFMGLADKPIEDVALEDVQLEVRATDKPAPLEDSIPEMRGDYPDAHMIGAVAPAYGLWARQVTGLSLTRVRFVASSPDPRPHILVTRAPCRHVPIDRRALVGRHDPELTEIDPHAPLMLGNGSLGFSADITGLQSFPQAYAKTAPLLIMADWAWHSFPNPHGYREADGLVEVAVPGRGSQPYAWIRQWSDVDAKPALAWLRQNPHRFSLGRIALALHDGTGRTARLEDLSGTRQRLDLWSGTLDSRFVYGNQPVAVRTLVHPQRDMVLVEIHSPLVASGQLAVEVSFPGVSPALEPDPSDWTREDNHHTTVVRGDPGHLLLRRQLDDTVYHAGILAPNARIERVGPHRVRVLGGSGDRLNVLVSFEPTAQAAWKAEKPAPAMQAVADDWRRFWESGGAVDLGGSTDPRAAELERRIVLSQYLTAINCAGRLPPQEDGLFANSWYGKFHLEMHPWHAAHFATWGRTTLLERSMQWYVDYLPQARQAATAHGVSGAWWPKMVGPEGRNSPSPINPFIMWQQPHPIYLAELIYRDRPDRATLERYGEVVRETARLLASWPRWDGARSHYVLGPPIIPVQETYDPLTTVDPAFELEYFRWGLQTAQRWRERLGEAREPAWDRVIAQLAPTPERDGRYLPVDTMPDFWRDAESPTCKQSAMAPCLNRDHPSFLMAWSLIGSDRLDPETLRRTLRATEADWDLRQLWGWDFPMLAMVAARLGEPDTALDWLFKDAPNNQWSVNGMTPRVSFDARAGTSTRVDDTYLPSNGSLLLAVGMLAAGWDGAKGPAPGFPKEGWTVRVEGIKPCF